MNDEIVYCPDCKHYREKAIANPFSNTLDVLTPDILALKAEWDKEQREIALNEEMRIEAGLAFDYEPDYVPWCWRRTFQDGGTLTSIPSRGIKSRIYVLCRDGNPDGQCDLFEAKD